MKSYCNSVSFWDFAWIWSLNLAFYIAFLKIHTCKKLCICKVNIYYSSKRHDLIDKFNDTSRYRDDIFTIDNPEFEKYIPDLFPVEHQLNKANTSDKETSLLHLNIKVIGSGIHTSVYDKRDDFGFYSKGGATFI